MCFPLSEMERDRILDFSSEQGAFVQETNSSQFVTNLKRLFPGERALVERLFPSHGHHLRLATRPDGDCVFLGPAGCVLPRDARPYYCHLFPFWVYKRRFTLFTPEHCLALQEGKGSVQLVEEVMGVRLSEIATHHGRLRLAWGLPPSEDMPFLERSFARYDRTSKRETAQKRTTQTGTNRSSR